jgi:site-specific recombinase XerD
VNRRTLSLEQIFDAHLHVLATTLRPNTVSNYRKAIRHFLAYLHTVFPKVRKLSQLRRDPHLLGWFRSLCDQDPPLCAASRLNHLIRLRRLLQDLADNGHPLQPNLIRREDFPPPTRYLPRPLSPEDDQQLQQQLRHLDNLEANALLLIRFTGMRIGECIDLSLDCLRQLSRDQWAVHVPLGKLHTEREVPVDEATRRIFDRILALRALFRPARLEKPPGYLLPRRHRGHKRWYAILCQSLADAARAAGCTNPVNPHRLRHTFATTMLRLGVSLPALMQLLGHKDIRMTLLYLELTQQDLQREFHRARQSAATLHPIPKLPLPQTTAPERVDLPTIRDAITAVRHLLQRFRLELRDPNARRKLHRLSQRLLTLSRDLDFLTRNECTLAG